MPAPLEGPSIVSKFVTLDYTTKICRQAYLPGKHYAVPNWPNVTDVNARGDYALEAHRLAYIDGSADPWRTMVSASGRRARCRVDKTCAVMTRGR